MTATSGDDPGIPNEPGRGNRPGRANDRPAGFVVTHVLSIATLLLPPGESRTRYRREFAAELYGRTPADQLAYALSVCGHMWSLRTVVVRGTNMITIPLLCRLNLHRWGRHANAEGSVFRTCSRCGREKGDLTGTDINSLFLPMGNGRREN